MNIIQEWSNLICISSMASIIFELILPPGKMEKMMRTILGIFMILVVILPFSDKKNFGNLNIKGISYENIDKEKAKVLEKVNNQIKILAGKNIKKILEDFLKDRKIKYKKTEVLMDIDKDKNIPIIKCKIYLDNCDDNLKEKIKGDVSNKLGIDAMIISDN